MKCSSCGSDNRDEAKFCEECGIMLGIECPDCHAKIPLGKKFCGECGCRLSILQFSNSVEDDPLNNGSPERGVSLSQTSEGERKYVTVLFSDLCGYTSMTEKLDPEEVKEIMSRIFGETAQIITKYEGFIDKFIGDSVMAIFGIPKAHEDDPVRAIKAAIEIHELAERMSPQFEDRIGQSLSMHSGINTGLVVTSEVDITKGSYGTTGDAINVASRLQSMAQKGEILVGADTYRQVEGYFTFEDTGPTAVRGKAEAVEVYKLIKAKESPATVHRLSGIRASLVGRKVEISHLMEALDELKPGRGRIFSIIGDAGTGKSRLIEEMKYQLNLNKIQWIQGNAYAYTQNIPYFPLINLLSQIFHIEETDRPPTLQEKIESTLRGLIETKENFIPYIGNLFSLRYPESENISPEFWKSKLKEGVIQILSALAYKAPTVFCLEDLHWADPSSLELLRNACMEIRQPAIVLCMYRPTFSLFTSHQSLSLGKIYQEIRLQNLSLSDSQEMLESLLQTPRIPSELKKFVQSKAEGNPFYLEELVNSLIESRCLVRENNTWKITRSIIELDISSSIHGIISGRLDRLEKETKQVLQEASVVGRVFLYKILEKITEHEKNIDSFLRGLEQLDLIRTRSLHPDIEYVFKHALTHEVVYSGLLKKDRQKLHERIGLVMEVLFKERVEDFYDTLAYHFKRSQAVDKAVYYLIKSAEKSLKRYAVEESHQYFKEAFDVLSNTLEKSNQEKKQFVDILLSWAFVFNHRGEYNGLVELFSAHKPMAESLGNSEQLGMFYAWLGWGTSCAGKLKDADRYLAKALRIGEEANCQKVIGYACAWLTWNCSARGLLDDAIDFGKRAHDISNEMKSDSDKDLFRFSLTGMGLAYWFRGEVKRAIEIGETLLDHGQKESDLRCMTTGYWTIGSGHFAAGNFASAIDYHSKAVQIAPDPVFSCGAKLLLGITYIANRQLEEAERLFEEVEQFSQTYGIEFVGTVGRLFQGIIYITRGKLQQGVAMVENLLQLWIINGSKYRYATGEQFLGKIYLNMLQRSEAKNISFLVKNVAFLIKNAPFAERKAELHYNKAIDTAKEIGAKSILGQVKMDLGILHMSKKRTQKAKECIVEAMEVFEVCEAEGFLNQAKELLTHLG
ncbi:MAG: adenylate/guanylate cyclase domain-containing protein [Thermodesulfobacteriota bacterium]